MGTRSLTAVVLDGEYKIAQYCQFDGYPDGEGAVICSFLKETMSLEKFKNSLRNCRFIDDEVRKQKWIECGALPDGSFVSFDVSENFKNKYPELSRDTGAGVLELVQDHNVRELLNDLDFAGDSLFCEYAYVLDMDNQTLEFYRGFQKEPLAPSERFASFERSHKEYYPVKLVKKYAFKDVSVDDMNHELELLRDGD